MQQNMLCSQHTPYEALRNLVSEDVQYLVFTKCDNHADFSEPTWFASCQDFWHDRCNSCRAV